MPLPMSKYLLRKHQTDLQEAILHEMVQQGVEIAKGISFVGSLSAKVQMFRVLYGDGIENPWAHPGVDIRIAVIESRKPQGTTKCRLTVTAECGPGQSMRVSFVERVAGGWDMANVAKTIYYQWTCLKKYTDDVHARKGRYLANEEAAARLVKAFNVNKGLRNHPVPPFQVIPRDDGLALDITMGCTEEEMRLILRTIEGLGLLPGGVRMHERQKRIKVKDRFERVG